VQEGAQKSRQKHFLPLMNAINTDKRILFSCSYRRSSVFIRRNNPLLPHRPYVPASGRDSPANPLGDAIRRRDIPMAVCGPPTRRHGSHFGCKSPAARPSSRLPLPKPSAARMPAAGAPPRAVIDQRSRGQNQSLYDPHTDETQARAGRLCRIVRIRLHTLTDGSGGRSPGPYACLISSAATSRMR